MAAMLYKDTASAKHIIKETNYFCNPLVNGIPGACYAGICYGANGFDYCDYFGYPCGGQPTNGPTSPPTSAPTTAPTAAPTAGPTTAAPTGVSI